MNSQEYNRRVVAIQIPDEAINWLFQDGAHAGNGLPEDARLIRLHRQPELSAWTAIFQSEEFDLVAEAAKIPIRDLRTDLDWQKAGIGGLSMTSNRYGKNTAMLSMSYEVFSQMFRDGNKIEHDLPKDTRLWKMWEAPLEQKVEIGFVSNEFEETPEGEQMKHLDRDDWSVVPQQTKADQPISDYRTTG